MALPCIAPAASLIVWQQYETFKVGLSPSKKKNFICFNDSPTKIIKNDFLLHIKSSFRSQGISIFVLIFAACRKNDLNRKTVNFEIYDVTTWLTKNYNIRITQYFTNQRQPDNEIWSFNRTFQGKYFCLKIMQKMRQANWFQIAFCFLKKLYIR